VDKAHAIGTALPEFCPKFTRQLEIRLVGVNLQGNALTVEVLRDLGLIVAANDRSLDGQRTPQTTLIGMATDICP
jgi:hypothetical protein